MNSRKYIQRIYSFQWLTYLHLLFPHSICLRFSLRNCWLTEVQWITHGLGLLTVVLASKEPVWSGTSDYTVLFLADEAGLEIGKECCPGKSLTSRTIFTLNFQKTCINLGKFWFSSVVLKSIIYHLNISYTYLSLLLKCTEIAVCPKHNVFLPLLSLLLGFSGCMFLLFFVWVVFFCLLISEKWVLLYAVHTCLIHWNN